ncbi:MAG TPA: carbon-nitrogen hydrolase [Spirochaetia bacterium]|nr:carbon-nitrogen hydrolase [Spirochaetia bacterium]
MSAFSVGLVQMKPVADPAANLQAALRLTEEAAAAGAAVVCLPELFRSPYFCQREEAALFDLAETIPGPSTEALGALARRRRITVIVPVFEKRAPGLYHNSAAVVGPDGALIGMYRKMHIPDDPGYYEKYYFTPGDLGFPAFQTPSGPIGTLICWDQWYPEAARLTALRGANVLFYPTAIGWHPREKETLGDQQREAWITVQRGHAIASGVYVAAVNRAGLEKPEPSAPGIEFWGSTFLCDPFGVVVARARTSGEEVVMGTVDLGRIEEVRRGWPFLRDRRVDAYTGLDKRFLEPGAGSK